MDLAYKHCLLGATNENLAALFEVDVRTIDQWISDDASFSRAVKSGREEADANVAHRLYSRATGYEVDTVKIFMPSGASEPVYAPFREKYAPETAAAIFWLKNRQPQRWRDKIEMDASVTHAWGMLIEDAIEPPLVIDHEPAHVAPPKKRRAKPVVRRTLKPRKAK